METNSPASQPYDAARALSDVADSREAVAARLVTPAWYHPILGANLGFLTWLVGHIDSMGHQQFMFAAFASLLVSLLLITAYKRLTGVWVGFAEVGPRARRLWILYGAVIVVAVLAAAAVNYTVRASWIVTILAILAAVATIVLGRRTDATMREELRDGSMPLPGLPR